MCARLQSTTFPFCTTFHASCGESGFWKSIWMSESIELYPFSFSSSPVRKNKCVPEAWKYTCIWGVVLKFLCRNTHPLSKPERNGCLVYLGGRWYFVLFVFLGSQWCLTLCDPMYYSTMYYQLLCPWDFPDKNTGVGCHFLLQGLFTTWGLNPGLPHCRQILYQLSYQGSP